MVNKKPQRCHFCGSTVPANGGRMWKYRGRWYVAHEACQASKQPEVVEFRFYGERGEEVVYQNRRGRCEDAPCCGCCS